MVGQRGRLIVSLVLENSQGQGTQSAGGPGQDCEVELSGPPLLSTTRGEEVGWRTQEPGRHPVDPGAGGVEEEWGRSSGQRGDPVAWVLGHLKEASGGDLGAQGCGQPWVCKSFWTAGRASRLVTLPKSDSPPRIPALLRAPGQGLLWASDRDSSSELSWGWPVCAGHQTAAAQGAHRGLLPEGSGGWSPRSGQGQVLSLARALLLTCTGRLPAVSSLGLSSVVAQEAISLASSFPC